MSLKPPDSTTNELIELPSPIGVSNLPLNVNNQYGGIGDATSHPLSQRFSNLIMAQVIYPHATALTNEIDWAAWQGALNAAATEGLSVYGEGTYIVHAGLTHPSHVHVWGNGGMTEMFSATDSGFKQIAGTTIRLKAGVSIDALWKSVNYDTITGVASPDLHTLVPHHMGLHYLKLDGNSIAGSACTVAKIYCNRFRQNDVDYVNGLNGGLVGEITSGGHDMEWQSVNINIVGCGGRSLHSKSLHDAQWTNLIVKVPNGTLGSPLDGIYMDPTGFGGGEQYTNVHVWGSFSNAHYVLGTSDAYFTNATSDGGGIQLLRTGNTFRGTIYGTNTPGEFVVMMGDNTTRNVGSNDIDVRVFNYVGSPFIVFKTVGLTDNGNRFRAIAEMGAVSRYQAEFGIAILTAPASFGAVTLNLDDTSFLPASGTLYADDGTTRTASLTYTGKTLTTLTGVAGVPAAGLLNGAALFVANDPTTKSSYEIIDFENTTSAGFLIERGTPTGDSAHTSARTSAIRPFLLEGINLGNNGTTIKKHMSATVSYNPGSVADGASTTTTITVTGAALGDTALAGYTSLVTGWNISALVIATDTVEVRITNNTGGPVDLGAGTLRADVWQHL